MKLTKTERLVAKEREDKNMKEFELSKYIKSKAILKANAKSAFTLAEQAVIINQSKFISIEDKIKELTELLEYWRDNAKTLSIVDLSCNLNFTDPISDDEFIKAIEITIDKYKRILKYRYTEDNCVYTANIIRRNQNTILNTCSNGSYFGDFDSYDKAIEQLKTDTKLYYNNSDDFLYSISITKLNDNSCCIDYYLDKNFEVIDYYYYNSKLEEVQDNKNFKNYQYTSRSMMDVACGNCFINIKSNFKVGDWVKVDNGFDDIYYGIILTDSKEVLKMFRNGNCDTLARLVKVMEFDRELNTLSDYTYTDISNIDLCTKEEIIQLLKVPVNY